MKQTILLFLKGFVIGIANIVPGVSGGTLAITLGIYEKIIGAVTHFFSKFKENLKLLIPIGIGAVVSILALSKLINFSLANYKIETVLLFVGLILGGVPVLCNKINKTKPKISYIIIFIITFGLIVLFAFLTPKNNTVNLDVINLKQVILLFIIGIVAAATMVIPGISGSFVLMLLGYYEPIVEVISKITDFSHIGHSLMVLVPFGIGIVVGIFLIAKLIEWLLKKYEVPTYYGIIGFVLSSILAIFIPLSGWNITSTSIGLVLCFLGFIGAYKLSKFE